MLFTSIEFLIIFLPITITGYYILRKELRNLWLLVASLVFYAWGEPKFVVIMGASIVLNYIFALVIYSLRFRNRLWSKLFLSLGIIANLSLIFIYKYSNFVTSVARDIFPQWQGVIPQTSIALPIGISFFTFQAISYIVDVYRGVKVQKNPINTALYIAMFPQLIAGPIVRYDTVAAQIKSRVESVELISDGISRFLIGFNKKMLLANVFSITADRCFSAHGLSLGEAWLGAICYTFQIYFDFSGYSDMAIGLGKMFGFEFQENFNYPYISKSITEFWRRWHMSLGSWFRDYLYFPLGGSRVGSKGRLVFNLSVVWFATGLWHGANWTFILWGCMNGVLIIVEKITDYPKKMQKSKSRRIIGWFTAMFFVVLGWVLFRSPDLHSAGKYLSSMFGLCSFGTVNDTLIFELREVSILLIAGAIASTPCLSWLENHLAGNPTRLATARTVGRAIQIILFFVGISYLVMNAHNPFIYFNF